jgi:hypothetical protein
VKKTRKQLEQEVAELEQALTELQTSTFPDYLPAGRYDAVLVTAERKLTKVTSKWFWSLGYDVAVGRWQGYRLWQSLVEFAPPQVANTCRGLAITPPRVEYHFDDGTFASAIGRPVSLDVDVRLCMDGQRRNEVVSVRAR